MLFLLAILIHFWRVEIHHCYKFFDGNQMIKVVKIV